jgi:hypothetical protein
MFCKKTAVKILKYSKKLRAVQELGGCCKLCGEKNIFKLSFHHTNPEDKDFALSEKRFTRFSILKKEIEKCELLCQNCHRESHYDKDLVDKRRNDKKIYLEYKGLSCEKCGYDKCQSSLTFHHKDKNKKEFNIGALSERINSVEELSQHIKSEIDKCEILCANCHVLEHSDVDFFENNFDKIINKIKTYREIQPKIDRELIRELYSGGMKQIEIAKKLNCSKSTISDIVKFIKLN